MTPEIGYVYHIKRPGMLLDKGYIGVSNDVKRRFRDHKLSKYVVGNAIRKHKDLECVILIKAAYAYCLELEETLRPKDHIGWNIVKGGNKPPTHYGDSNCMKNPEIVAKVVAARRASGGYVVSEETRMKISKKQKGVPLSEGNLEKLKGANRTEAQKRASASQSKRFKGKKLGIKHALKIKVGKAKTVREVTKWT